MFYETTHPIRSDYFTVEKGENHNFPAHIHVHFELITLFEGEMNVTVDGKEYFLTPGKALLIFPNQIHSMETPTYSRHILCIFSPELVRAFSEKTEGILPVGNVFDIPRFYVDTLAAGDLDGLAVKGLLYSVCGLFNRTAKYTDERSGSSDLLFRIFRFVEENRNGNCSLKDLSEYTFYDYVYLSKYFKRKVGIPFGEYVNAFRLGDACYKLKNSQEPILDIALECGFASLRSFNRNFRKSFGMTPTEYRK